MSSTVDHSLKRRLIWGLDWRLAALKNGFQDTMVYRIEFVLEVLGSAAVPAAVQMVLWHALFIANGDILVAGHTYAEMMTYTAVSVLFSQVRGGNHDFDLVEMIRTGGLSQYLLRPVSVVEFVWIQGVAGKLLTTALCLALGLVLCPIFGLNPLRILGAMVLALMGNIIHYQVGALLATVAFAWEEAYSMLMVKNMLVDLLSGELIPLFMFPASMAWIWKFTPFYLYVYGPTQYALGKWSHSEMLYHVGIAGLWLVGLSLAVSAVWRLGIRRYSALGG